MDDAGTTLAGIAANVRSGKSQVIAQETDEQQPRLDFRRVFNAVDLHPDRHPCRRGHGRGHGLCTLRSLAAVAPALDATIPIATICRVRSGPSAYPTGAVLPSVVTKGQRQRPEPASRVALSRHPTRGGIGRSREPEYTAGQAVTVLLVVKLLESRVSEPDRLPPFWIGYIPVDGVVQRLLPVPARFPAQFVGDARRVEC